MTGKGTIENLKQFTSKTAKEAQPKSVEKRKENEFMRKPFEERGKKRIERISEKAGLDCGADVELLIEIMFLKKDGEYVYSAKLRLWALKIYLEYSSKKPKQDFGVDINAIRFDEQDKSMLDMYLEKELERRQKKKGK